MKSWINYHSHTHFCDGETDPEKYIQLAISKGHPAYGYSSHAPVPFKSNWNIPDKELPQYLAEIKTIKQKYNSDIEVYLGLEVDFIPGFAGRNKHVLKNTNLDYFIGSVHFVDQFNTGEHWNIDTSAELFHRGLLQIFEGNMQAAATRFYEITRQMIVEDKPHVVGHLDKIKMFNKNNQYFSEQDKWYAEQIEETLDCIKQNNAIVEINTRGYYRYGQTDLYPGEWIIKKMVEKDIPLMINSDAHRPEEIEAGMEYAAIILKKLGVQKLYALYDKCWQPFEFSSEGLFIPQKKE